MSGPERLSKTKKGLEAWREEGRYLNPDSCHWPAISVLEVGQLGRCTDNEVSHSRVCQYQEHLLEYTRARGDAYRGDGLDHVSRDRLSESQVLCEEG